MGSLSLGSGYYTWAVAAALVLVPYFASAQQTQNSHCLDPDNPPYCLQRVQSIDYLLDCKAPSCQIPGQLDFYGLGVRLGIYFAWLASWLANNFVADEMAGALDTNAIFLLSLTTTVIISTVDGSIFLVDSLILIQLGFGFVFGVMSLWGYRTRYYKSRYPGAAAREKEKYHFGGWGTHCRLALCTMISFYALWFWTFSVANPSPNCFLRPECGGLQTFLFTSVPIMGWTRWVHTLAAAVCVIYYGVASIVALITFVRYMIQRVIGKPLEWIPQYIDEGERRVITAPYILLSAVTALWLVFTVFCVEFTLNSNHVAGVLAQDGMASPGQLLPLLVGLFSLVRLLWIIYKQWVVERRMYPSPESPNVGQSSGSRRELPMQPMSILVGLITAWLPWLNCFESWRQQVGIHRRATQKFHMLPHHENKNEREDALKLRSTHFENRPEEDQYG